MSQNSAKSKVISGKHAADNLRFRTLLLGFGNADRQDDGLAWHVLTRLASTLGRTPLPDVDEGFQPDGRNPDLLFVLQLTPELAETLANYERVAFIDAHTGQIPQEIQFVPLEPGFQSSPFTHHMTPATLLSLSESLYGRAPQARLLSVRGYEFGFERGLSEQAEALAEEGVELLLKWMKEFTGDTPPPATPASGGRNFA